MKPSEKMIKHFVWYKEEVEAMLEDCITKALIHRFPGTHGRPVITVGQATPVRMDSIKPVIGVEVPVTIQIYYQEIKEELSAFEKELYNEE